MLVLVDVEWLFTGLRNRRLIGLSSSESEDDDEDFEEGEGESLDISCTTGSECVKILPVVEGSEQSSLVVSGILRSCDAYVITLS